MGTVEFVPGQQAKEAMTAHVHLDDLGPGLRWGLRGDDLGDEPVARGHHPRGHPRHAPRGHPHAGARLRERGRVPPGLVRRRGRQARPVRPDPRGLGAEREDQRRGALGRDRRQPGERPADHHQRVDRPARAEGRGRGRDRHVRHLRRHPRDEEQPDRRDGPAATTSAGTSGPRPASRSSASRGARRSRTT